jgi:hypothetical protein
MEFPWMLPTVTLGIGMVIFFIGYSIRVYEKYHLIAGFKESQQRNKKDIARWIGGVEIFGGLVNIALGLTGFYFPEWSTPLFVIALFFTIFIIIVAVFLASEFKPGRNP